MGNSDRRQRWWFYWVRERVEWDRYQQVSPKAASFLQAGGTEVWPVRSADPEADYRDWKREQPTNRKAEQ